MTKIISILYVIAALCKESYGLKCFSCYGITHPRFCDYITTCTTAEVCGLQRYQDTSGEITFNVGCVDNSICSPKRGFGPLPGRTCTHCCNTDLCNLDGCGEHGYTNHTGVMCYNCKGYLQSNECRHVTGCNINEACFIEENSYFGEAFFSSGCRDKHICHSVIDSQPVIGKRDSKEQCNKCCVGNLCNDICHAENTKGNGGNSFAITTSMNRTYTRLWISSQSSGYCTVSALTNGTTDDILLGNRSAIYDKNLIPNDKYKIQCNTTVHIFGYISLDRTYYSYFILLPISNCLSVQCIDSSMRVLASESENSGHLNSSAPSTATINPNIDLSRYFIIPRLPVHTKTSLLVYGAPSCNITAFDANVNKIRTNMPYLNGFYNLTSGIDILYSLTSSCPLAVQLVTAGKKAISHIPGLDRFLSEYIFSTKKDGEHVLITIQTSFRHTLTFNGIPLTYNETNFRTSFSFKKNYSQLEFSLKEGAYIVRSTDGAAFGLWFGSPDIVLAADYKTDVLYNAS